MGSMKFLILYILRSFPTVTEMSTLNEITGMVRRGIRVSIVSLKSPANLKQTHQDIEKYHLRELTYYLNVSTGIKRWKNIILRTIYGQVKLFLKTNISLRNKIKVSTYSLQKKSRRLSLIHLVDLINHIAEKKPDVIYFHFAVQAGELIILRKIFKIPFVVFFHGFDFSKNLPFKELNYPEMFRYGDWFFVNSGFSKDKVLSLGCPPEKISVPGLPVDDMNYPFRERVKSNKVRLLTVARLVEKKGLYYAILAFSECHIKFPGLEYEIIGEGPLRDGLTDLIKSIGMQDHIRLSGNKTKDQVIDTMLNSDIFILTSITAEDGETEGLGMVLLESQLTGMPVLATLHNGFTDAVRDGISGFLVPEKDIAATGAKLAWMMDHPETWAAMGKAGRQHVMANYSEQVYLEKILNRIGQIWMNHS
jgi:colanic acid/amylovoran biosynthesis glycosyltransferase